MVDWPSHPAREFRPCRETDVPAGGRPTCHTFGGKDQATGDGAGRSCGERTAELSRVTQKGSVSGAILKGRLLPCIFLVPTSLCSNNIYLSIQQADGAGVLQTRSPSLRSPHCLSTGQYTRRCSVADISLIYLLQSSQVSVERPR